MKNNIHSSIQIEFDDNSILSSLFGVSDKNIQLLEKLNNVSIDYRGNIVKIIGASNAVEETKIALQKLFDRFSVYHKYMKFSIIKSVYYLFCLGINYLKKKLYFF